MPFPDIAWPGGGAVPCDPAPHWDLNGLRLMLKDRHTGVSKHRFCLLCKHIHAYVSQYLWVSSFLFVSCWPTASAVFFFFFGVDFDSRMSQQFGVTYAAHGRLPTYFCLVCLRKFFSPLSVNIPLKSFLISFENQTVCFLKWWETAKHFTKESDVPSIHTQRIGLAMHLLRKLLIRQKKNNNFNQAAQCE